MKGTRTTLKSVAFSFTANNLSLCFQKVCIYLYKLDILHHGDFGDFSLTFELLLEIETDKLKCDISEADGVFSRTHWVMQQLFCLLKNQSSLIPNRQTGKNWRTSSAERDQQQQQPG